MLPPDVRARPRGPQILAPTAPTSDRFADRSAGRHLRYPRGLAPRTGCGSGRASVEDGDEPTSYGRIANGRRYEEQAPAGVRRAAGTTGCATCSGGPPGPLGP